MGLAAMAVGATMVSCQTAGKALRDAVFLANYEVSQLPAMVMAAALTTIALSLLSARWMVRYGPGRLVTRLFLWSGVAQLAEWAVMDEYPRVVAPIIYLHIVSLTAILGSGFWTMLSEEVQLRQARRLFARVGAWSTAGAVIGGLVAERVGAWFGTNAVMVQMAGSHLLCAALLWRFATPGRAAVEEEKDESVWTAFSKVPYLGPLAVLVLLGTSSAAALDFLFKSQAKDTYGQGPELLRFLALFHTASGILTFLMQAVITRASVAKIGLPALAGSVPAVVGAGSVLSAIFPGFPAIAGTRLLEASARVSLFKNGYELFYTPIPSKEKRAVKTFIDVVCDRMGDALSSVIVQTALVAAPGVARYLILGFTGVAALVSLRIAARLDVAYHEVVERGLLHRANQVDPGFVDERSSMSMAESEDSSGPVPRLDWREEGAGADPVVAMLSGLRSGSLQRTQETLARLGAGRIDPNLAPALIQLLSRDEVAHTARDLLVAESGRFSGLLIDTLRDPGQEVVVRRRIPRIVAAAPSQVACDGLILGLADERFEVRFQCGRGLDRVQRKLAGVRIDEGPIFAAVVREVSVNTQIWDSRRVMEERDEEDEYSFLDEVLRERSHQSMEHVFTLLALVLPREPVRTAFRALHSGDRALMDLALEYLERAVPAEVRQTLWPVLVGRGGQIPEDARRRAARDLLLTERGLLLALKKIDEADAAAGQS